MKYRASETVDNATLLAYLWEAEDDIESLARLLLAVLPPDLDELVEQAEQIVHKWEFRRNRRLGLLNVSHR